MNGQVKMQEPCGCVQSVIALTGIEKRRIAIYKVTNQVNGKIYIGQTVRSIKHRFNEHVGRAKKGCEYALHRAICKHGEENFSISEICCCESKSLSDEAERFYIKHFKTRIPDGYNLTGGGDGRLGFCHSEETRAKMSRSSMGQKCSEETRAKLSRYFTGRKTGCKSNIGRKHSDAAKAKVSKSLMGNKRMAGYKLPDETKVKISEALKGKPKSEEMRAKLIGNKYSLGHRHSDEARANMSKAQRGNTNCLGHKLSEETRSKIGKALTGIKRTEETKDKMRGKTHMVGFKMPEETKLKISKSMKGRKKSQETRARMSKAICGPIRAVIGRKYSPGILPRNYA